MPRPKAPKADSPYPPGWEPFLAAINADLDDDTPRLVFADWLQENGDEPRAQFIRFQCAAARGDPGAKEAEALLAEHRARWLVGLPKWVQEHPDGCVFRRGFITALTVLGHHWLAKSPFDKHPDAGAQAIRRITALEELRIEQVWNTVMERRTLIGIRVLNLPSAASGTIESLAKSPILPSLTELAILAKSSDGLTQQSFRALFANPKLDRLRRFCVESVPFGTVIAVGLWARWFASLEELRLRHTQLGTAGAQALAQLPAASNLRVLELPTNPLEDDGLRSLLASPGLRNLEQLDLSECDLTPASARTLADWEGLQSVRSLNLLGNDLRAADAEIIAKSPHARNLTDLRVVRTKR